MFKKFAAVLLALLTFAVFAAVDVNKATQAELDGIKGIGPGIAGKIMEERKKSNFKDWTDFVDRVKGVGEGNAAKFSAEGLTVNGATFKGMAAPAKADAAAKAAKAEAAAKPAKAEPAAAVAAKPAKEEKAAPAAAAKAATPATPAVAATPAATAKPAAAAGKVEAVKGASKDAANDAKAKPLEAVGAKK